MSSQASRPRAPAGLGTAGKALWKRLHETFVFESPAETAIVEQCCRQRDLIAELEALVESEGPTTVGSKGQPRLHPAVGELRLARQALAKLLGSLRLPVEPEDESASARRARRAAEARWQRRARVAEGRGRGEAS